MHHANEKRHVSAGGESIIEQSQRFVPAVIHDTSVHHDVAGELVLALMLRRETTPNLPGVG